MFLMHGKSQEPEDDKSFRPLMDMYAVLETRLRESQRADLREDVILNVEERHSSIDALLPFIYGDSSVRVIASAALAAAVLAPPAEGEPLIGPEFLLRVFDDVAQDHAKEGIFVGRIDATPLSPQIG